VPKKKEGLDDSPLEIVTFGFMLVGPDHNQGDWLGWRIHANQGENMIRVAIVKLKEPP